MKVIWKGGMQRGGMAQWAFFVAVAAVVVLAVFVLAALGLVVGVLLAGIIAVVSALASRRRSAGVSVHVAQAGRLAGEREPEGDCVELDEGSYTVRIVDEKNPSA